MIKKPVGELREMLAFHLEEHHPPSAGLVRLMDELIDAVRREDADKILDHFIKDRRGVGTVSAWQIAQEAAGLIQPKEKP